MHFSIDRWDFPPINPLNAELNPICHLVALLGANHILHISRVRVNQLISFVFQSICFLFLAMCSFQCNFLLKCSPMHFTASVCGMIVWLVLTAGQWPFGSVNIKCQSVILFSL